MRTWREVWICFSQSCVHIIYPGPVMSFWSYPIKSSWESNDQQNMETRQLVSSLQRSEEMSSFSNNFIQTISLLASAAPTSVHIIFSKFSHTYKSKQYAFNCQLYLFIHSVDISHLFHLFRLTHQIQDFEVE